MHFFLNFNCRRVGSKFNELYFISVHCLKIFKFLAYLIVHFYTYTQGHKIYKITNKNNIFPHFYDCEGVKQLQIVPFLQYTERQTEFPLVELDMLSTSSDVLSHGHFSPSFTSYVRSKFSAIQNLSATLFQSNWFICNRRSNIV